MLGERYALYHFQENPEVEGYFDYRLRTGAATERNAIRLLARMGFPSEVVDAAMACTDWMEQQSAGASVNSDERLLDPSRATAHDPYTLDRGWIQMVPGAGVEPA